VACVPKRIDEQSDAPRATRVELFDFTGVTANRALGHRTCRPRLAVAELVELIAESKDTTWLDPV